MHAAPPHLRTYLETPRQQHLSVPPPPLPPPRPHPLHRYPPPTWQYCKDDVLSDGALQLHDLDVRGTEVEDVALGFLRRFRTPSQHDELLDYQQ